MRSKLGINRFIRLATAGLAVLIITATVSWAHTEVADSSPKNGETVEAAPQEVWVRFGDPMLPAHPGEFTDGHLVVLDACGQQVDGKDSQVDDAESKITVTSGGAVAGRYEVQWFVAAADGDSQAGVLDFVVSSGEACPLVKRTDVKKDIDLGLDPTRVTSKLTNGGSKAAIGVETKNKIVCSDLAKKSDSKLELQGDINDDETVDVVGTFVCKKGAWSLFVQAADAEKGDPKQTFRASHPIARKLLVKVPVGEISGADGHLDFHVISRSKSDDCGGEGEDAKVCLDRAPDLGWLRSA